MVFNLNVFQWGLELEEDFDKIFYVKGGRKFIVGVDGCVFVIVCVVLRYF